MAPLRLVTVRKGFADPSVGVHLIDAKDGVMVAGIAAGSPLEGQLEPGDIIRSINGRKCDNGHADATETMRSAPVELNLVVASATRSRYSFTFLGGSTFLSDTARHTPRPPRERGSISPVPPPAPAAPPMLASPRSSPPTLPKATTADGGVGVATAGEPLRAAATPQFSYMASRLPSFTGTFRTAPTPMREDSDDTIDEEAQQTLLKAGVARPLSEGEYIVSLSRNRTASIGMRLMQRHTSELPFVSAIDPHGPAAHTDIKVGDVLVEVNAVDARGSQAELKRALASGNGSAQLRMRRPLVTAESMNMPPSKAAKRAERQHSQVPEGYMGEDECVGPFLTDLCTRRGRSGRARERQNKTWREHAHTGDRTGGCKGVERQNMPHPGAAWARVHSPSCTSARSSQYFGSAIPDNWFGCCRLKRTASPHRG